MTGPDQPSSAEQLNAAVRAIQLKFLNSLEERILVLENASTDLRKNPAQPECIGLIRHECHKLAGISGSIGFPEIGELAGTIDAKIKHEQSGWGEIEPMLERLMSCMEELLE